MNTVGLSAKALDVREKSQPGCKAAFLAAGRLDGDLLHVPADAYATIQAKHPPLPHLARRVIKSQVAPKRHVPSRRLARERFLLPLARLMRFLGFKRPGDTVERLAKPIARVLQLHCHDRAGRLKPGSPCAQSKAAMNEAGLSNSTPVGRAKK